jgi:ornithine cyclodeaminase/alanine dehydrogenase-like protein (mu-crystallin family)
MPPAPLLLDAAAVRRALAPGPLFAAVEAALVALDRGELTLAPTVRLPGLDGGFHLKSAAGRTAPARAAVKLNGNFPANRERHGLPTIQGVVALLDLERGRLLALLDSSALTALRTAAVSALAARRLARRDARTLALVGCGVQAAEHLALLARDFPLAAVRLLDRDAGAAERLARRAAALGLAATLARSVAEAARGAGLIVTSTPAAAPLLCDADVAPGAFVAAVGADDPSKCELEPALLARSRVVVDSLAAASTGGDLRAALAAGAMTADQVHGELPALLAGRSAGRTDPAERFVFDSTGLAAADLAAASLAFDASHADSGTPRFDFASTSDTPARSTP